jgi:hypothetical protein
MKRLIHSGNTFIRKGRLLFFPLAISIYIPTSAAEPFEAFLTKHCVSCHGPKKAKGDLRLDQLSRDFKSGVDGQIWAEVVEKINAGKMPPEDEPRPTANEIGEVIEDLAPENIGILVEKCLFHDMPNGLVISTLDCGRRKGPGYELLNASNMKKYAPHDIDVENCVFGHTEKPLRSAHKGGYGVNQPTGKGEHMRMILFKDAYDVRYKDARIFGDRVMPVHVSSIGGSGHLSREAAGAITLGITGNLLEQPAPPLKPGVRNAPFVFGPQATKRE